jgi:hypothetical protein
VADIHAPLVQQILHISERERESHLQHHRQANDLQAGFEVFEGLRFLWGS